MYNDTEWWVGSDLERWVQLTQDSPQDSPQEVWLNLTTINGVIHFNYTTLTQNLIKHSSNGEQDSKMAAKFIVFATSCAEIACNLYKCMGNAQKMRILKHKLNPNLPFPTYHS